MTEEKDMTDLLIPDEALQRLLTAHDDDLLDAIASATRLVVADELRRLVGQIFRAELQTQYRITRLIEARIKDLDPGTPPTGG